MARSRLEKIGTIFDRVSGLLRTSAIKREDKPVWYDIYQAFPPKYEPRFDVEAPNTKIHPILYKEDLVRAKFQKSNALLGTVNLLNMKSQSNSQRFLQIYRNTLESKPELSVEHVYSQSIDVYMNQQNESRKQKKISSDNSKVTLPIKNLDELSQLSDPSKTVIKDIFKE